MAIRVVNSRPPLFDVLLLCRARDQFINDVVASLIARGYVLFVGECDTLEGVERAERVNFCISRARLSAAIVGPEFLSTAWTASEISKFEQVEVRVLHGVTCADLGTKAGPSIMVFDSSDGAACIASNLARACGIPGNVALPSPGATLCWRCGTSDLSRASTMVRARECPGCANDAWRDPERPYDPDPLGMGLVPSINCCGCGAELDARIRFRNRDVTYPGGVMKIQGVACPCGGEQFTTTWSGGCSPEEEW